MKTIFVLAFFVIGCSQSNDTGKNESYYREALLRTVQSNSVDKNIDTNNPLELHFFNKFEGQLIEFVMEASPMNTYYYSVVNSDEEIKNDKTVPVLSLGELRVELNNQDITSCLVAECNQTKCHGLNEDIQKFTGTFNTKRMYINLTKLKYSQTCPAVSFQDSKMNKLVLKEVGNSLGVVFGARVRAQIIAYNRTYRIQDIQNIFNN